MLVRLFKCVARAALVNLPKALVDNLPFGNAAIDFARDMVNYWKGYAPKAEDRRADLRDAAVARPAEILQAAEQAVAEVAADQPEPIRRALTGLLTNMPGTIRRSLSRPEDQTGTTVPVERALDTPEDVGIFLPVRAPHPALHAGKRFGDWELVERVGAGGFGEVWKATNPHLPPVALKFCTDATAAKALRNEAALLGRVVQQGRHPGIVALLDTNLGNDPPYLKYEYVAGGDLSRLIRSWLRLPVARLVDRSIHLMGKLADIVGFAHRQGIVHRDLKPANILLQPTAAGGFSLRVADFGIGGVATSQAIAQARIDTTRGAFLTEALRGACTPLYASPQQMRGEAPDPRDDIHALGIIWLQILTGDLTVGVSAEWRDELAERGVPGPLLDVLGKCLATKAERRFVSASVLATELAGLNPTKEPGLEADVSDFRKACLRGDYEAFLEKRSSERIANWRRAAEWGLASGQCLLGSCLWRGAGVARDDAAAAVWFRRAADQGDSFAQNGLGCLYRNGEGVAKDEAEAVRWFRKAAEQGNARGQYNLGRCYQHGTGVEKDEAEAVRWLRMAAEQGDADAQWNLGWCYQQGNGVAKDEAEGARWLRKAAEQGFARGQYNLGVCYYTGEGIPKDNAEAIRWFRLAAEQGYSEAQWILGRCYHNGTWIAKDEAEAVRWYRKAAEQGYAFAQYELGDCYRNGRGVPKDEAEAVRWFRKAADQGNALAQDNLGDCYRHGTGITKDEAEAVRWYRMAADQGYAFAQWSLGRCYHNGTGIAKDAAEAVRWYRKAAEQGNAFAQFFLGWCYEHGAGIAKDEAEAVRWFRLAAEQGHADAQCFLGRCYGDGTGIAKDAAEAVRWYRKAAEQGNALAQWNLGWCYEHGAGIAKDEAEAVRWYRKAAEQGDGVGQWSLGRCYEHGAGIAKDEAEAVRWYRKAADQGYASGQYNLGRCYHHGTGIAKDEAEALRWFRKAAEQGHAKAKEALTPKGIWKRLFGG